MLISFVISIKIGSIEIEYKAGISINLSKKIRIKILQKVTSYRDKLGRKNKSMCVLMKPCYSHIKLLMFLSRLDSS